MIDSMSHNPPEKGGEAMLTMVGRDPAWTDRAMAELFAHATRRNLVPCRWEIGFFNARDLEAARSPGYQNRPWQRLSIVWGCEIHVVSFHDGVALVAKGADAAGHPLFHRFVAGDIE